MSAPVPVSRSRRALIAGVATAIGSLPHRDPAEAARLVLDTLPQLPAVPQLPSASPREGMLAQWLQALPEVTVAPDGSFTVSGVPGRGDPRPVFDERGHAGLLAFLEAVASARPGPPGVKAQVTGPLTLGLALAGAGVPAGVAFERAAELVEWWIEALLALLDRRLPGREQVVFLDEPGLIAWNDDEPLPREDAVDLLSGVLARIPVVAGVHVCGEGDRRMAVEAGPEVVGVPVTPAVRADAVVLGRYLDAGGWIAWGAVPTDRPVGERPDHYWNGLVTLWCDLTRAGCDPVLLRAQSLVTPACGLAGHDEAQAERILRLTVDVGERVRDQAVGTRLTIGA